MDKVKDAIIEDFEKSMEAWRGLATKDNMFLIGRIDAYEMAIATVKYMFKTVGHGKWDFDKIKGYATCSECGRSFEALPTDYLFKINNIFCRHCGANMRGANENVKTV